MRNAWLGCLVGAAVLLLGNSAVAGTAQPTIDPLPLVFETNLGQLDAGVDFLARGKGFALSLSRGSASLHVPGAEPLRLVLEGANEGPIGTGVGLLPGRVNYLKGRDPSLWTIGAPLHERAQYADVYPGIDVVYYPNKGELEYDFIVAPGADFSEIRIRFEGASTATITQGGALELTINGGAVLQHAPVLFQEINGARVPVSGHYTQHPDGSLGFEVGAHNPAHTLVIDPMLTYSSLFAGSAFDAGAGVVAKSGTRPAFYTAGSTEGLSITATSNLGTQGDRDIYVAKIDPYANGAKTLEWLTIVGGSGTETASDIGLYAATEDAIFVGGTTTSTDLPAVNPLDGTLNDGANTTNSDGFLLSLDPFGTGINNLTYVGGTSVDTVAALTNIGSRVYLAGETASNDIPLSAFPFDGTFSGTVDVFFQSLDYAVGPETFSRQYSSYLGAQNARPLGIAAIDSNRAVVVGQTFDGLTLKNAFQAAFNSGVVPDALDGFVAAFDTSQSVANSTLIFSSYLGGNALDFAQGVVAVGTAMHIVGRTASTDLPANLGITLSGAEDGFLAKITLPGVVPTLNHAYYIGGNASDGRRDIAAIGTTGLVLVGATNSTDLLTVAPEFETVQSTLNPNQEVGDDATNNDGMIIRLPDINSTPPYADDWRTYFGGRGVDAITDVATDSLGRIYVAGQTTSTNFPSSNGFDKGYSGAQEGFVAVFNDVVLVDSDSPNSGLPCGDTWASACQTVGLGLSDAGANSEIWIDAGTYNESGLTLSSGQRIYGGFTNGDTVRSQRNPLVNLSIMNGDNSDSLFFGASGVMLDGIRFANSGGNNGAVYFSAKSDSVVSNCVFYQNNTFEEGGGLKFELSTSMVVANCQFIDNTGDLGAGMAIIDSGVNVANCTFALNTSTSIPTPQGESLYVNNSGANQVRMLNCILWGDGAVTNQISSIGLNAPILENCIVEGGFAGTNITDTDPQFATPPVDDITSGDLRPVAGSPAIDGGVDASGKIYGYVVSDADGQDRDIRGTDCTYDIGAFEADDPAPFLTLLGTDPIQVEVNTTYSDPGATANGGCGEDVTSNIVADLSAVDESAIADYTVTYNVVNALGQAAATLTRVVQVQDTTPPVVTLTGARTVTVECGNTYTDAGATALDNGDGDLTGSITVVNPVDTAVPNTYTVTYDVSDSQGNDAAQETRTVSVVDNTPPVIALNGAATETVECGDTFTDAGFSAEDTCGGNLDSDVIVAGDTVDTTTPNVYIITYNVEDRTGNSAIEVTRTVTVQDTAAPAITVLGANPLTLTCGDTFIDPGATALDACDGDITSDIVVSGDTVNADAPGTYTISYNVEDTGGRQALAITRTVNVEDTTPPTLTLVGATSITLQCRDTFTDDGVTANDACGGDLIGSVVVSGDTVDTAAPGTYTILYDVSDASSNAAPQLSRSVTVEDNARPTITLNGDAVVELECGDVYTDAGATANDACDGSVAVTSSGTVDTNAPVSYTILYDAQDASGNDAVQAARTVNVVDTTPPSLLLQGSTSITLECGTPYAEPGFTATDTCDGNLAASVVVGGDTVNKNAPGTYAITYEVEDGEGNSSGVQTRTVTFEDTTEPVITELGADPLVLECGTAFVDPGATALDGCGGTTAVQTSGTVDTEPSDYTLTYTATDAEGNEAQETRLVQVVDATGPSIILTGADPVVLECNEDFVEPGFTATDACDGDLTSSVVVNVAPAIKGGVVSRAPGNYTVTYQVTDNEGNTFSIDRGMIVQDTTPPLITLNGSNVVNLSCADPYNELGATADDACEGTVAVTLGGDTVDPSTPDVYTVTYDAVDSENNDAAQTTRTVNVLAGGVPVINLVGSSTITVECSGSFTDPGATALDDCSIDLTSSIQVSGTVNPDAVGIYTLTYSVTDADSNFASIDRTVEVVDTTPPLVTLVGASVQTLACGTPYTEQGALAQDACDGDLTGSITIVTQVPAKGVDPNVLGLYTLEYQVTDSAGNLGVATRTVEVVDGAGPVITLNGAATLNVGCNSTFTDPGVSAFDACEGNVVGSVVVGGDTVNTANPGAYVITYDMQDGEGNPATQVTRTVNVVDVSAPVITLLGAASVTVDCGGTFTDPGATASDTCQGNLTGAVERIGIIDFNAPGNYTLTYVVQDNAGNQATPKTRTVQVRNNCPADGEGDIEGEGEGVVEGEGEGTPDGEGEGEGTQEGEGEGAALIDCDAPCGSAANVDQDGDGLIACEEAFFGTSDLDTDSDRDGMADNFEVQYCPDLNPADPADATQNPDGDSFINIEEFLRRGDPLDPNSPTLNLFVAPATAGGEDAVGRGSAALPFATISFALTQAVPTPTRPVSIVLANGTYLENIVLKPGIEIQPLRNAAPVLAGTIIGADKCTLTGLIIAPRTGGVTLLSIDNAGMMIRRCTFRGTSRRDSTGILITGSRVRDVQIEECVFERLAVGIDVDAGHPGLRRSRFSNLSAVGMIIRCDPDQTEFSQFDGNDPRTGYNTFEPTLDGPAVINECPAKVNMERNDWGVFDPPTPETIEAVIVGNVNFEEFLNLGSALFSGTIFCNVWDADDQEPIENAQVAIAPGTSSTVRDNDEGVYAFPAVASGLYTIEVEAPGYDQKTQTVQVGDGQLASVTIALRFNGVVEGEDEGEGEGEDPPPGGCPCNQNKALGPPQLEDLALSLLTFMALAASTLMLRRQSQTAWRSNE